jgi:predicted alpha/beta hydrolase family esterase
MAGAVAQAMAAGMPVAIPAADRAAAMPAAVREAAMLAVVRAVGTPAVVRAAAITEAAVRGVMLAAGAMEAGTAEAPMGGSSPVEQL